MTLLEHVGQLLVQNSPNPAARHFCQCLQKNKAKNLMNCGLSLVPWMQPVFVPPKQKKTRNSDSVIQDLFPFSMFRSLEKRCFYGLIITFGHGTLWNFPVLPSAPWNKDRILQLIGKFNSTARVDSHVVFFLWTTGVSLIPRGFINQLLFFFFEGWSRNAHLNSMIFLVLRNIP